MNKRFAIFDMDGTLIDSMGIWNNLGREYLDSKGIYRDMEKDDAEKEIAIIMKEIATMTMSESAEYFRTRFSLPGSAGSIAHEMNGMMDEHYKKDIPLKHGVKEYLQKLKASGVHMCVASATAEPLMVACLERLGVLSYFDFILSCESMNTSKREPEIYLEAARRFQAAPEETAVYEDVLYAVRTAKHAGFYVVGVYDKESEGEWTQIWGTADETINWS